MSGLILLVLATQSPEPDCGAEPGRRAELVRGRVERGAEFSRATPSGWILRLRPADWGWVIEVTRLGREGEDLARLTPPWHFVPNPRHLEGWHFRNAANTGPNDGSVNAPGTLRDFIFSPEVGRGIEYSGSATTEAEVERVRGHGRGWLLLESYQLTPPGEGERAAFEAISFAACLTFPR